jgi:hypothetical protein
MELQDLIDFNLCFNKNELTNQVNIVKNLENIDDINIITLANYNLTEIPEYIKEFKNLAEIHLENNNLKDIKNLKHCKKLKYINLSFNNNIIIDNLFPLYKLKYLNNLNLKSTKINFSDILELSERNQDIKKLYLLKILKDCQIDFTHGEGSKAMLNQEFKTRYEILKFKLNEKKLSKIKKIVNLNLKNFKNKNESNNIIAINFGF